MRILVTGATGFSGQHLCRLALARGAEVFGMARAGDFPVGVAGIEGDVTDRRDVVAALDESQPNWIFHLAAALPNRNIPAEVLVGVNILGTVNLLMSVADMSPERPRILIVSSSAVYGHTKPDRPVTEESRPTPLTVYGMSKLAQEVLSREFGIANAVEVIRVRTFNLTGPGEPASLVCGSFARQIAKIEKRLQSPTMRTGTLQTTRDFTDVRDAIAAYWAVMEQGEAGAVYNVCSSREVQIGDVARRLAGLSTVSDIEIIEAGQREGAARQAHSQVGDNSRLRETIGWLPMIPLSRSFEDLLTSWRQRL